MNTIIEFVRIPTGPRLSVSERMDEYDPAAFEREERERDLALRRRRLLETLRAIGIAITEDDRARIESCNDRRTLEAWRSAACGAE